MNTKVIKTDKQKLASLRRKLHKLQRYYVDCGKAWYDPITLKEVEEKPRDDTSVELIKVADLLNVLKRR